MTFKWIAVAVALLGVMMAEAQGPGGGRKLVVVTALAGQGTWADPRRPALPAGVGLNYRWVASDDGQWAIVDVELPRASEEGLRALDEAAAGRGPAVKVFERGRGKKEDVERELRRYRKDFDLDEFLGGRKAGGAK